ncbi:MAG: MmgE/PrpD family protein [Burkholderiales bacterium]|nr:MmgE/PrpD family protein [Burkholderiales bacterium]
MTSPATNTRAIAEFVASMGSRELPPEVLDTARLCLADWLGVALGAIQEPAAHVVHDTAKTWQSAGRSTVLLGGSAAAPIAALCNGTLAHCLDFDDTYVKGITHISAPVWAATLAVGEALGASEQAMLAAYITGFETAARAGYDLGELVTARGWHSTGVFGRIGAAAAASVLLRLDAAAAVHALGAAATQASGLTASFGTMAKPFHAGKAAMDGVIAAQLAAKGFRAAEGLLDPGAGLDSALIQDRAGTIRPADFSGWEILNNSFKPYAACHLTHPAIDAAKAVRAAHPNAPSAREIKVEVGALAKQVTGEKSGAPTTGLEGKFDLKYCIALALHGHTLSATDFREPLRLDPAVAATAGKVQVSAHSRYGFASARVQADLGPGDPVEAEVSVAKGHPGNPIGWSDMRDKFTGLLDYAQEDERTRLFARLKSFGGSDKPDVLHRAADLVRSASA